MSTARDDALPPEPVERFRAALARLIPDPGPIGLAVSGGPDSMAMLLLAQAAIPGRFAVATVNHGLRAEAAEECALVERACAARGIPCSVLQVKVGAGNLQEQARFARYGALIEWAQQARLVAIATAHHADDQAETLLMRLNRGSGVTGLSGIREATVLDEQPMLSLIRPLLAFRRAELAQLVERAGVELARDPSNRDDSFDRVRIRNALADADWVDPAAFARSAAHLADADAALEEAVDFVWSRCVSRQGERFTFQPLCGRIMRLRVIGRIIRELGGSPRGGDVARLLERLESGKGGNLAGVLATTRGSQWCFRPEPPRRDS